MITYKTGNLLDASVHALVNTVNTIGVMGKGIALQFKNAFPENAKAYTDAVREGKVKLGQVLIVPVNPIGTVKYIVNFPTKGHWRYPSKLSWIKSGLQDLKQKIVETNITSIALPPLGCGNGGLDWNEVKPVIEKTLGDLTIDIIVYEPSSDVQEILKNEEKPSSSRLTPVRAMLLQLLYHYRALGEFTSEFAAEKLSYFLQRFGESQLKLNFQKGVYGPYSGKVRHVLYAVNGYYLKGFEQKNAKPFEPLEIIVEKASEVQEFIKNTLSFEEQQRLQEVAKFIQGFESPYGLELLATVDFLIEQENSFDSTLILQKLWSDRKKNIFPQQHIELAIKHLSNSKEYLYHKIA